MKSFVSEVKIFIFRPKTMDYSPWFDFLGSEKSSKKRIASERASQGEQNDAKFSFIAPSSEELRAPTLQMCTHGKGHHRSGLEILVTPHWKVL